MGIWEAEGRVCVPLDVHPVYLLADIFEESHHWNQNEAGVTLSKAVAWKLEVVEGIWHAQQP
jgi:hypothetical protein